MTNKRVAPPMGCHSLSIDWKKMLQAARTDEGRNICSAYFFENIVLSFSTQFYREFFLSLYSEGGIPVLCLKKRLNEVCSLKPKV